MLQKSILKFTALIFYTLPVYVIKQNPIVKVRRICNFNLEFQKIKIDVIKVELKFDVFSLLYFKEYILKYEYRFIVLYIYINWCVTKTEYMIILLICDFFNRQNIINQIISSIV